MKGKGVPQLSCGHGESSVTPGDFFRSRDLQEVGY